MPNSLIAASTTAGNNTDVGGNSIAEGQAPSSLNNAIRQWIAYAVQRFGSSVTVASASTVALGDQEEQYVTISGTTTITSFGTPAVANQFGYWVMFSGALTLTHNGTSLILPGAANITTAAGDMAFCQHEGSGNWRVMYFKGDGTPVGAVSNLAATAISGKTEITDVAENADFLLIWDATDSALKKVKPENVYTSSAVVKSSALAITTSSDDVFAHGLSAAPDDFGAYLIADGSSPELGYSANQRVNILSLSLVGSSGQAVSLYADATNVTVSWGSAAIGLLNISTNTLAAIDVTKWTLVIWARA